jgi:hypothetical protein
MSDVRDKAKTVQAIVDLLVQLDAGDRVVVLDAVRTLIATAPTVARQKPTPTLLPGSGEGGA